MQQKLGKLLPPGGANKVIAIFGYLAATTGTVFALSYLVSPFRECPSGDTAGQWTTAMFTMAIQIAAVCLILWLVRGLYRHGNSLLYQIVALIVPAILTYAALILAISFQFSLGLVCLS